MFDVFHAGELAVQPQAGVTAMAARVGRRLSRQFRQHNPFSAQ